MNGLNLGASSGGEQGVRREDKLADALTNIAFLRPAGDVNGVKLKDAHLLIERMERIALDALGGGL